MSLNFEPASEPLQERGDGSAHSGLEEEEAVEGLSHADYEEVPPFLFLLFFITLKPRVEWYKSLCALNTSPPRNRPSAAERRGNTLRGCRDFYLKARARIRS